jgi:hypothetical protein
MERISIEHCSEKRITQGEKKNVNERKEKKLPQQLWMT